MFPSTWRPGDMLTFKLSAGVTFSATPTVNVDEKAYDVLTHIADTSGDDVDGSVEDNNAKPYEGTVNHVKPDVVARLQDGDNSTLELVFRNSSAGNDAKFIGAINGARVNVPTGTSGDVELTMGAAGANHGLVRFVSGKDVTNPAAIVKATLAVENGAVVADGTPQYVGPITVNGTFSGSDPLEISLANATFDTRVSPTAKQYGADGKEITGALTVSKTAGALTVTPAGGPNGAVRVVLSGMAITPVENVSSVTYSITKDGNGGTPDSSDVLGGGTGSQKDIVRAKAVAAVQVRTTPATADRLGGVDRYDTATRLAGSQVARDAYNPQKPQGESETVVIASGENYADALSAGYLVATQNATLILTQKGQLSSAAQDYLRTYGARKVFIIGGEAAVSKNVEEKLQSLPAYDVQAVAAPASSDTSVTKTTTYTQGLGTAKIVDDHGGSDPETNDETSEVFATSSFDKLPFEGFQGPATFTITHTAASLAVSNVAASGLPDSGKNAFTVDVVQATGLNAGDTAISSSAGYTGTLKLVLKSQGKTFELPVPAKVEPTWKQVITFDATASTQESTTDNKPPAVKDADKTATGDERRVVATGSNLQVIRLAGENRFITNRNVNEYALRHATQGVGTTSPEFGKAARRTAILANGLTPWDALAAGPLVGHKDDALSKPKPIILTMGSELEGQAKGQLSSLSIQHAILVGGNAVLPEGLGKELSDRGVTSARLAGANRWETAKAVGDFLLKSDAASTRNVNPGFGFGTHRPFLVNGGVVDGVPDATKWADALAIGPVAAKDRQVVTLTDSAKLPEATEKFYTEQGSKLEAVIPVGGTNVVSNAVVEAANKLALAK